MLSYKVLSTLVLALPAAAHLGFWHPSMYGFDDDQSAYPFLCDNNPSYNQWWFHGNMDKPPADGQFFELPAGGTATAEIACSKRYTSYGGSGGAENGCPNDFNSLHEPNESMKRGSAIAIAYKSDPRSIKPEDFAVISTDRNSPWSVDAHFAIPADLPACPEGGCHCMWGWVHGKENGGDEFYMVPFKCKVTGAKSGAAPLPQAAPPVPCKNGGCVKGLKQPIFWGVDGGNLPKGFGANNDPPFYNEELGFTNGAQDLTGSGFGGALPTPTGSGSGGKPKPSSGSGGSGGSGHGSGKWDNDWNNDWNNDGGSGKWNDDNDDESSNNWHDHSGSSNNDWNNWQDNQDNSNNWQDDSNSWEDNQDNSNNWNDNSNNWQDNSNNWQDNSNNWQDNSNSASASSTSKPWEDSNAYATPSASSSSSSAWNESSTASVPTSSSNSSTPVPSSTDSWSSTSADSEWSSTSTDSEWSSTSADYSESTEPTSTGSVETVQPTPTDSWNWDGHHGHGDKWGHHGDKWGHHHGDKWNNDDDSSNNDESNTDETNGETPTDESNGTDAEEPTADLGFEENKLVAINPLPTDTPSPSADAAPTTTDALPTSTDETPATPSKKCRTKARRDRFVAIANARLVRRRRQ